MQSSVSLRLSTKFNMNFQNNTQWFKEAPTQIPKLDSEENRIPLGKDVFLDVGTVSGEMVIHLRQWSVGGVYRTKRGFYLRRADWEEFKGKQQEVLGMIGAFENGNPVHRCLKLTESGVYASLHAPYPKIDLRLFFKPEGADQPHPTNRGLEVSFDQVKYLFEQWNTISERLVKIFNSSTPQ